ncbi:MAG: gamma-glutamylcyclotransferase [Rhizobiaceae bacterium]|nr:gamma-glutamylcyclotransferase [Rhizobiaceae bacterium]
MHSGQDPFHHHPELRGRIIDPLTSYFRDFNVREVLKQRPELHWVLDELRSDAQRQASRRQMLDQHGDGDLWVFAYGSLMWDPAFVFTEVRRARLPDYARRFILKDTWGARGTREIPGLMAALDQGDGCEGLAYRIARQNLETETEILWRREMIGRSYVPTLATAQMDGEPLQTLTFVADHSAASIHTHVTRQEQIELLSTGSGFIGTSLEYLQNVVNQFTALGIVDKDCSALLEEVEAHIAARQADGVLG